MGKDEPTESERPKVHFNSVLPKFNIHLDNLETEWRNWYLQFQIFLKASNLEKEDDTRKSSLLLHHMGSDVLSIFQSFQMDIDQVKYAELV
ncbi:hypothetical protein M8J77_000970 [Diaphorina citri]|nr:hypothetical protein M8J77_000970 [Diaphorina citri]